MIPIIYDHFLYYSQVVRNRKARSAIGVSVSMMLWMCTWCISTALSPKVRSIELKIAPPAISSDAGLPVLVLVFGLFLAFFVDIRFMIP